MQKPRHVSMQRGFRRSHQRSGEIRDVARRTEEWLRTDFGSAGPSLDLPCAGSNALFALFSLNIVEGIEEESDDRVVKGINGSCGTGIEWLGGLERSKDARLLRQA
jgi:hypothetical protein